MDAVAAFLDYAKCHVPFHRRRAPRDHLVLANWPLMAKEDLAEHPLDSDSDLLSEARQAGGYLVASGGTTVKPKYVYYSHGEVAALSANIGRHFMANGMAAGDGVVNYMTAGDMWSSFILVDKALSGLPVTVFPLGYSPSMDSAMDVFARFKPSAIVGITSMIVDFARHTAKHNPGIRVRKVYYAGEPMLQASADLLISLWGCEFIRSAGYASTDVGSIAWQCPHCKVGEHFAFDDTKVEIINDELVVTPLFRKAMPIIRYRTGDKARWASPSCDCGRGAPCFQLLGRLDNVLLVWGCRILCDDVAGMLEKLDIGYMAAQMRVQFGAGGEQVLFVRFECQSPPGATPMGELRDRFYAVCEDLHGIVSRERLERDLFFESVPVGSLERNPRTGKVIPVIDARV